MKTIKDTKTIYEIEHYKGSLDFPCDFCNTNAYNNFHFKKDRNIIFVVCKECLKQSLNNQVTKNN